MKVVLAEKPSVARDIAKFLKADKRGDGFLEGGDWVVTWAFGHLVELKEPEEYRPEWKSWRLSALPIVPDRFELRSRQDEGAQKQLALIKSLFEKADELICATDAGREGELIFRYIQQWANCERKPLKRLWISSLTASAISKGFSALENGSKYDNLYQAARCRSEADWIVGMNATRFFTVEYGKRNLLLSIGRVQTPILAMIVGRDQEIANFKSESFWEVRSVCRDTKFRHTGGRLQSEEMAKTLYEKVKDSAMEVVDVQKKNESTNPPLLFDLTELQREMNRRHGLTADETLRIAQNLYESKHITYPRTDSRYLSSDLKLSIGPLLKRMAGIKPKEIEPIELANLKFTKRIIDDSKVSDHHAIIPTEDLPRNLSDGEKKVYGAIFIRLIAAFYPPCIRAVTTVEAIANSEKFRARGTVLVDEGWEALYPKGSSEASKKAPAKKKKGSTESEAVLMPDFQIGEQNPHEPSIETFKTNPPRHFTEASLLQLMETAGKVVEDEELKEALKEKGVGTPATRASIIEVLIQRKYVERKRKNLISTDGGRHLIALIQDDRLKSPELTGDWEFRLKKVERGEYDAGTFMEEVVSYTKEILQGTSSKTVDLKNLGPCPKCKAPVMRGKSGYGCSKWKEGCDFVIRDGALGASFNPSTIRELLLNGNTLEPHALVDSGKPVFGTVAIGSKGELSYTAVDSVKANEGVDVVGDCPVCGSGVVEGEKGYGCLNWRNGCRFIVWKKIAQKEISRELANTLIIKGETDPIDGFVSKAGKPFTARLKVVGSEVKFDFRD